MGYLPSIQEMHIIQTDQVWPSNLTKMNRHKQFIRMHQQSYDDMVLLLTKQDFQFSFEWTGSVGGRQTKEEREERNTYFLPVVNKEASMDSSKLFYRKAQQDVEYQRWRRFRQEKLKEMVLNFISINTQKHS
jgi:hypothetical protein